MKEKIFFAHLDHIADKVSLHEEEKGKELLEDCKVHLKDHIVSLQQIKIGKKIGIGATSIVY